jgi:UDP-N-acetylmuramoyl-tripeptide--D-alanyl-D-alanine ligase
MIWSKKKGTTVIGKPRRQISGRRYAVTDIPWLLSSPMGRAGLSMSIIYSLRLVLMPLAALHRKTNLRNSRVTAVVGSFGKTTITLALRTALTPAARPHPKHSTDCYIALDLLRHSSRCHQMIYAIAIDRPGRMAKFASMIQPQEVVVCSIGSAHCHSFGDLETTRDEKAWMVRALEPSGLAILNADDPHVMWMATQTQARIVTFGFDEGADVRCLSFDANDQFLSRMAVLIDGEIIHLNIQLMGSVMAYPVLAALAAAWTRGLSLQPIVAALEALTPVPGRLQTVRLESGITLICDDHKSSLEMMEKALECLNGLPAERRMAVLGEIQQIMGDEADAYRRLGAMAGKSVDVIFFLGKNSALELLCAGFADAGRDPSHLICLPGKLPDAVRLLESTLKSGDTVLFKGKRSHWLQQAVLQLRGKTVKCELEPCGFLLRCSSCPGLGKRYRQRGVGFFHPSKKT